MMPMPDRLLSSMAVRLGGRIYLFDAGEATQIGWKKAKLGLRGLTLVAVTHLHADHCLGLPGMMMFKAQVNEPSPLTILGPPGIRGFVEDNRRMLDFHINYRVDFVEWHDGWDGPAYEDDQVRVIWKTLKHTRLCLGYRIEEHDRPGKFDPLKAEALGIERGPLWGRLQRGEAVAAADGRKISPDAVVGPGRRGRHIAYVVDTRPVKSIYALCRNVDAAFIEGMFLSAHREHAEAKGHLTAEEAAKISGRAGVASTILVHTSLRYTNDELQLLEKEASQHFPSVRVGRDMDVFAIDYPDQPSRPIP